MGVVPVLVERIRNPVRVGCHDHVVVDGVFRVLESGRNADGAVWVQIANLGADVLGGGGVAGRGGNGAHDQCGQQREEGLDDHHFDCGVLGCAGVLDGLPWYCRRQVVFEGKQSGQ